MVLGGMLTVDFSSTMTSNWRGAKNTSSRLISSEVPPRVNKNTKSFGPSMHSNWVKPLGSRFYSYYRSATYTEILGIRDHFQRLEEDIVKIPKKSTAFECDKWRIIKVLPEVAKIVGIIVLKASKNILKVWSTENRLVSAPDSLALTTSTPYR